MSVIRGSRAHLVGALAVVAAMSPVITGCTDSSGDAEPTTTSAPTSSTAPDLTPELGDPEGTDARPPLADDVALPIVFVHGFAGSAQQYESQAMRFVANGYPQDRIIAWDHDGAGLDIDGYATGVDQVIDDTLAEFEVDQVYLVGHSRGTFVGSKYLADPAHAAKVAKYVAIDGAPCVDVVPCLAPTQAQFPGQSHVEVATSKESFAAQYEFLVGTPPEVVGIEPQKAPVVLSGRAVVFPANNGRAGATLEVWAIDESTGERIGTEPYDGLVLDADGGFGPLEVETGGHYEYVLSTDDSPIEHHLYLPPYERSSDLVRLLSSEANGTTRTNTNVGDDHSAIVAMRMREWYSADDPDLPGADADVLTVSTDGGAQVDVITDFVGNGGIGLHLHDDAATPGVSSLTPLPYFSEQPFQSGIDVFMPARPSAAGTLPTGTITLTSHPRGDAANPEVVNVPNWPSSTHSISVVFSDH
ncbi:alpha/beta fold hydrolase [soil metagenome]